VKAEGAFASLVPKLPPPATLATCKPNWAVQAECAFAEMRAGLSPPDPPAALPDWQLVLVGMDQAILALLAAHQKQEAEYFRLDAEAQLARRAAELSAGRIEKAQEARAAWAAAHQESIDA
jgi:hypothetical protein